MLLIHCPYCEQDLPELEFAYAGEAHIARPLDPMSLSDEAPAAGRRRSRRPWPAPPVR
ncbi:hypothetical protein CNY89_15565 [Amaricoccus sp. HAR-UPW-R2A-40]|nr:hypothetical protein CNY89_15565 [Amaricoccus sp. HAR-UPW-R2A-40]